MNDMIQGKTIIYHALLIVLGLSITVSATERPAIVSGTFYPASSFVLGKLVDSLIAAVPDIELPGKPKALISPHAGYVYSGPTAAYGYSTLKGHDYSTVILIGPSHRIGFDGCAVYDRGSWLTPLGSIPVDSILASRLISASDLLFSGRELHSSEHSLEVQLPFLQRVLEDFKIVPIEMGFCSESNIVELGQILSEIIRDRDDILLIASTDLSHYLPRNAASNLDQFTISFIENMQGRDLARSIIKSEAKACGGAPTAAVIIACKRLGIDRSMILKYDDSGTASGDTNSVVGYVSAVIFKEDEMGYGGINRDTEDYLSKSEQSTLLKVARSSIEAALKGDDLPDFDLPEGKLTRPGAAFVTLEKNHQLRGCIGYTEAIKPLYECVSDCAISAAFRDPRFPSLAPSEYPDITVEISVLTPLEPVDDISRIVVGRDGLMISRGGRRGLLLPQVATEYGWNREEFLSHTCVKAGLPENAWKEGAKIEKFSAFIFGED